MRHIISVVVENKFGVLARIAGLFSGRGYNIDSLTVGITSDPMISRMTIVVRGNDTVLEQVKKQLNKLIDVIKVIDFLDKPHIERELILLKVNADKQTRSEIMGLIEIFRGKVVDISPRDLTVEITGHQQKLDALIEVIKPFGIKELARTGKIAMARGIQNKQ